MRKPGYQSPLKKARKGFGSLHQRENATRRINCLVWDSELHMTRSVTAGVEFYKITADVRVER
jgi:hypothetical protein